MEPVVTNVVVEQSPRHIETVVPVEKVVEKIVFKEIPVYVDRIVKQDCPVEIDKVTVHSQF